MCLGVLGVRRLRSRRLAIALALRKNLEFGCIRRDARVRQRARSLPTYYLRASGPCLAQVGTHVREIGNLTCRIIMTWNRQTLVAGLSVAGLSVADRERGPPGRRRTRRRRRRQETAAQTQTRRTRGSPPAAHNARLTLRQGDRLRQAEHL